MSLKSVVKTRAELRSNAKKAEIKARVAQRLDFNENHSPEDGKFTSSGGTSHKSVDAGTRARFKVHSNVSKEEAQRHVTRINREETKLRASGGRGNYEPGSVKMEKGFQSGSGLSGGKQLYHVTAVRLGEGGNKLSASAQRTNDRIAQSRASLKAGADFEAAKQAAQFKGGKAAHEGGPADEAFVKLASSVPGGVHGPVATSLRYHMSQAEKHEEAGNKDKAAEHRGAIKKIADLHASKQAARGGAVHMKPEELEKHIRTGNYTMLTAANPASQPSTPKSNAEKMRALYKELNQMGAHYIPTVGKYGAAEPSVMVMHDENFGRTQARALGVKYGQTSVMHAEGGKATIYHTTGKFAGRVQRSIGLSFDPGAHDNFTGHQGTRFSFHFPDESWENPEKE